MKVSLTQKIFAGNFLLLAAIVGMVVILFRERSRMREIDFEVHDLQSVRNDIHAAQFSIAELALLGAENGAYPPTQNGLIHPQLLLKWP